MVAGYDGYWTQAMWDRFPNAVKVHIAVRANQNTGQVGDVETGDMLPWEAPDWCLMRRAAGVDPTIYLPLYLLNPTRTEFQLRGIPEPHWWIALWDNDPTLIPGCVSKQYANEALTGGHFDLSVVADYWPGVDDMLLDPNDPIVMEIRGRLERLENDIIYGPDRPNPPGPPLHTRMGLIADIWNKVQTLGGGGGTVDNAAIAKAVTDRIGRP